MKPGVSDYIHSVKPQHIPQNLMLAFCMLLVSSAGAQTLSGEQVLAKFNKSIETITNLHYTTQTIDSFISGNVWKKQGEAMLVRDPSNLQFPFRLYGKDENNEFIFDGQRAINIYHDRKEFEFRSELHYRTFVGLQGGQMLMYEILFAEKRFSPETGIGYNRLEVQELATEFVLTLYYPDNNLFGIRNRVKTLTIDKKSGLPVSCYHTLDTDEGERQVNIRYNSNIKINDLSIQFPVINTAALNGYREVEKKTRLTPAYEDLLENDFIDMKLKNIDGSTAQLSDKKNKVILLAFWETWCGPCLESIPKIKALVSKYPSDDFEVWGIASDEKTFAKLPGVVKRSGINYPVFFGTDQTKKDYHVTAVPEYVIIDQSGKIVFINAGFTDDIEKTLDALLK